MNNVSPFEAAKQAYPGAVRLGNSWWQLVDGGMVSGMSDHDGKMILQEDRDGCSTEFNHWGTYIMKDELKKMKLVAAIEEDTPQHGYFGVRDDQEDFDDETGECNNCEGRGYVEGQECPICNS